MNLNLKEKIFYFCLSGICIISIFGSIVYYFYALNLFGILITLVLSTVYLWIFYRIIRIHPEESVSTIDIHARFTAIKTKYDWVGIAFAAIYLILTAICIIFLFLARTDTPITSPWQVVSANFFIFYFITTVYLIWLILINSKFTLYLTVVHYILSFVVLLIVYKIGYGYDPFIHQATVSLINDNGAVLPKTPYYLGQYSLIAIASKLLFIPVPVADKLLVPILAALTIPPTIHLYLQRVFTSLKSHHAGLQSRISIIFLLIIPFSIFTFTVPQSLAYLFLLLCIFFSLLAKNKAETLLSFALALAALSTHLIAGIPAILFAIAMLISRQRGSKFCFSPESLTSIQEVCIEEPSNKILKIKTIKIGAKKKSVFSLKYLWTFFKGKKLIYGIILTVNLVILPILFYFSGAGIITSQAGSLNIPAFIFPRHENIIWNSIYFIISNHWIFFTILAGFSIFAIYRLKSKIPKFKLLGGFFLTLLASYLLVSQLNFTNLIGYEQGAYAQRIIVIAFIFLLPIISVSVGKLLFKILTSSFLVRYSWLAFLLILVLISLYSSYPRLDSYYNSRGFAVSASDLAAVKWAEQDSDGKPYVVLANQQVSVGALWTFGFKQYYKNDIFFYPIPTGGPLYQIYLDMVYKDASSANAKRASELTGVNTVYFVINKYWADFGKIVEEAKINANSFENINDGEVYVFKFNN